MKILLSLLHFGYHRNFASVLRELAQRGHEIHVAAERDNRDKAKGVLESLSQEFPNLTLGTLPPREHDDYRELVQRLRFGFDYIRYLEPTFHGMPGLRMRAEDRVPLALLKLLTLPGMASAPARAAVRAALRGMEQAVPPSRKIEAYLKEHQPDLLLVTPLIGVVGSYQLEYVDAAKRLGIPTAFCVWSWDNLSSKALIRDRPDRVFVWNDIQKDEAMKFHAIPPSDIVVTGAQCFDQWFGRTPSRSREQFCREVGLPDAGPYVLYVGSTMVWKSPPEANFVVRWITHLRGSANPVLQNVNLLVRPHPARLDEWKDIDTTSFPRVAFSGMGAKGSGVGGGFPIDAGSKNDYFDALYYSAAVVGINTSAFIEAGIIGRPVLTILAPEYSGTQAGTIHFKYLTEVGGGVARPGREFDEHEAQLAETLAGTWDYATPQRGFLNLFVRPHGLDVAATPRFCDEVEKLSALARKRTAAAAAMRTGWKAALGRRGLAALVRWDAHARLRQWLFSPSEAEAYEQYRELREGKAEQHAGRLSVRDARRAQKRAERDAEWARHKAARAAQDAAKKGMRQTP